jgi:4-amino-4-deoxy-L-arabinose transferase-like glycosyltransferase
MLTFFLALSVLLAGSLPWVAVSRPPNKSAWLLACYLVCSANVVLTGYIVNSFRLLDQQWVMIAVHAVLGGPGWLIWGRRGKPSLWGPFQGRRPSFNVQWLKREPLLALLFFSIALAYGFALAQIVHIPQNNMDSLSTHLSRIVFWRQNGSFFPWQTYLFNQVWYPVNAQLQTYWTLLFLGSDRLVGIAQWLAALASAMGVFGMARFFGYNPRQSAFAALIFLSFPLIALQSTTTQTDLVTTVFFILAVYFLVLGLRDGRLSLLSLSAISIGLGVGVKKSYFLLLPVLAVLALLAAWQFGRRSLRPLLFWSLNLIIGVALFGAYIYVVNWRYFGDPFGSPTYIDTLIEVPQYEDDSTGTIPDPSSSAKDRAPHLAALTADPPPGAGILMELVYNTPRLLYQSLDTSGLPRPLDGYAHKVKMRLVRAFFQAIGFEEIEGTAYTASGHVFSFTDKNINEESHAWYGPLSVLLILPALVVATRQGLRRRIPLLLGPGTALLVFLPLEIILRPGWDPFQGRYFAPLVALCAPLMAVWFREKGTVVYEWLIGTLAVVILAVTLLYNPAKPTLGKFAEEFHIWNNNDRIFIQTIQRKNDREMYYMVERFVPADATLGYYIPFFILDYPLFGEKLERRLVPMVSPAHLSDLEWLRSQDIDYLLLPAQAGYPTPPVEYQVASRREGWDLYEYVPVP